MIDELIAYSLALFVGITLGMVGAGGSILTVPILIYIAGIEPQPATTYSSFIVGITAFVGSLNYYKKNLLHINTAIVFFIPSLIAVFLMRRVILPEIPDELLELDTVILTKNFVILLIFGFVMLFSAMSMIRSNKASTVENQDITQIDFNYKAIFFQGLIVGTLTGLVGVGGGFLIVPSLVRFAKLPIRLTIGTSLVIITINSLSTFGIDYVNVNFPIDWRFLLIFSTIAVLGLFVGLRLSNFVKATQLKTIFGYFVLSMGLYILAKEIFGAFVL